MIQPPLQSDRSAGWLMFILLLPFQFVFGLIYAWGTIAPVIHQQTGWSNAQLDLAFGVTPLSLLPTVIWAGRLVERHAIRKLLGVANICFAIGGGIGLTAHSTTVFLLGYSVLALGMGAGFSTPACMAAIAMHYPAHKGKLGGGLLAVYGLSAMISAPLFHGLLHWFDWRGALASITVLYGLTGWLAWWALPTTPVVRTDMQHDTPARLQPAEGKGMLLNIMMVLSAAPLGSASFAGMGRLLPSAGFNGATTLLLISGMALANGLGRFMGGVLADKLPEKTDKMLIYLTNAMAFGVFWLGFEAHWLILPGFYPLMIGCAFGALAGNLPSIARLIAPHRPHAVFGMLFGTFALGSFIGPLSSATIGLTMTLWLFGGLSCCAALVAVIEWVFKLQQRADKTLQIS